MGKQTIASLRNISKIINGEDIFSIDNLQINKGDFITIKGASGSGKTTLLNILGMNDKYSSGTYNFLGREVDELSSKDLLNIKREKISFLFQDFGLVEEETIDFNLEIGLKYSKLSKEKRKELKIKALERVNLTKKLNTSIRILSGGEKQRVALARIILKPSILILADEPTGSLDSVNRNTVANILYNMSLDGKSIVIVTHDDVLAKLGNKSLSL